MSDNGLALTAKEAEILNQTTTMDDICKTILQGGSLVDLSETWAIPFGTIRLWMAADDQRDKAYIKALNMRSELEAEKIKRELHRIAFADLRAAYRPDGSMKPFSEWPAVLATAVQGVQFEGGRLVKVNMPDKLRALELAGKAIAMFNEKLTVDGSMNLEQMLVVVDKQARALMQPAAEPKVIEN